MPGRADLVPGRADLVRGRADLVRGRADLVRGGGPPWPPWPDAGPRGSRLRERFRYSDSSFTVTAMSEATKAVTTAEKITMATAATAATAGWPAATAATPMARMRAVIAPAPAWTARAAARFLGPRLGGCRCGCGDMARSGSAGRSAVRAASSA